MNEQHETYPNIVEAVVLIVVLMLIEMFVSAAMFDSDFLTDADWVDVSGLITVIGNGILFIGLMAYKRIGYRALFHPTRNSLSATLGLEYNDNINLSEDASFTTTGLLGKP